MKGKVSCQTLESKRLSQQRYKEKFPQKRKAANAAQHIHVEIGKHKHHWSYRQEHWRDIIILNIADHAKLHRYMIYDPERLMYRTLEGMLLDTKDRHIEYFESLAENQ